MSIKKFEFYLVLNWKKGTVDVKKRKPKEGLSDVVIKAKILLKTKCVYGDVKTPENKVYVWKGEIEIPETKVGDIFMDMV